MVIWNFLSVLQRRERPDRFSSTVTARRDIWPAATVRVSRPRTFATGASTVPMPPTKVACDPKRCHLPNCWCSKDGTAIPGNLTASTVPQMISITFDDAVNAENFELFSKIFSNNRKNPNGCPARATFYVSHQYTNYRDVQYCIYRDAS